MEISIVIARYDETLYWVNDLKFPYIIYNKGNELEYPNIKLPNIGREAYTYLHHIIHNYATLTDYIAFLQGIPGQHILGLEKPATSFHAIKRIHQFVLSPKVSIAVRRMSKYKEIINKAFYNIGDWIVTDNKYGKPSHREGLLDIETIFTSLFAIPCFSEFTYGPTSQFIVSRDRILYRSKKFYEACLKFLTTEGDIKTDTGPWIFERLWPTIFDGKTKDKWR